MDEIEKKRLLKKETKICEKYYKEFLDVVGVYYREFGYGNYHVADSVLNDNVINTWKRFNVAVKYCDYIRKGKDTC